MLAENTLLILGAGSSLDFGLPTGPQLTGEIKTLLRFEDSTVAARGPRVYDPQNEGIIDHKGRDFLWAVNDDVLHLDIPSLQRLCVEMSAGLDDANSIDNYIEVHREREPKVEALGKAAIVERILQGERASVLGPQTPANWPQRSRRGPDGDSWMHRLFRLLQEQVTWQNADKLFAKLDVITFNYDRLFEAFMVNRAREYYHLSSDQVAALGESLSIVHVYGAVGAPPWRLGHSVGQKIDFSASKKLIRTYSESVASDTTERVGEMLSRAKKVIFLGFAFWPQNMRLLDAARQPDVSFSEAFSTAFASSNYECNQINEVVRILLNMEGNVRFTQRNEGCDQVFIDYSFGLRRAF